MKLLFKYLVMVMTLNLFHLFNENKLIAKTIATLDTKKKNLNFTIPKILSWLFFDS
jgi:hypothetical protein